MKNHVNLDTPKNKNNMTNTSNKLIFLNHIVILLSVLCIMSMFGCSFNLFGNSVKNPSNTVNTIQNAIANTTKTNNGQNTKANTVNNIQNAIANTTKTNNGQNANASIAQNIINTGQNVISNIQDQSATAFEFLKNEYELHGFGTTQVQIKLVPVKSYENNIIDPFQSFSETERENLVYTHKRGDIFNEYNKKVENAITLINAVEIGRLDIVKKFIPSGADANAIIPPQFGLIDKTKYYHTKAISSTKNEENIGMTFLGIAVKYGYADIIDYLLRSGANVNLKQTRKVDITVGDVVLHLNNPAPLAIATASGNMAISKTLINSGAEVNAKDNNGLTALHYAALNGNTDNFNLLLSSGADINTKDNNGLTALHCAALNGNIDNFNLLLSSGADINTKDNNGLTALHFALTSNNDAIIEKLLSLGANVNAKDNDGLTPLHIASSACNAEVARKLIAVGTDVNAKQKNGLTPLHAAAAKNKAEIVHELISAGADINAKSNDGYTPLHSAAANGSIDALKDLLAAGADVYALSNSGESPHNAAIDNGHANALEVLNAHRNVDDSNNEFFDKQVDVCTQSKMPPKPTDEQIRQIAQQQTIEYLKKNKGYANVPDDKIVRTKDYVDLYEEKYKSVSGKYSYTPGDKEQDRRECIFKLIKRLDDIDQLLVIYDFCKGSEVAWLGSIGGKKQNESPIPPDVILDSDDYSFKSCISQFAIYNRDYVTSKDYFLDRLNEDYDKFAEDAEKVRKDLAKARKKEAEQQAKERAAMQKAAAKQGAGHGNCINECEKTYGAFVANNAAYKECGHPSFCNSSMSNAACANYRRTAQACIERYMARMSKENEHCKRMCQLH